VSLCVTYYHFLKQHYPGGLVVPIQFYLLWDGDWICKLNWFKYLSTDSPNTFSFLAKCFILLTKKTGDRTFTSVQTCIDSSFNLLISLSLRLSVKVSLLVSVAQMKQKAEAWFLGNIFCTSPSYSTCSIPFLLLTYLTAETAHCALNISL
jgi:hypothetical protein